MSKIDDGFRLDFTGFSPAYRWTSAILTAVSVVAVLVFIVGDTLS